MYRLAVLLPLVVLLATPAAARAEGEIYPLAGNGSDSSVRAGRPAARAGLFIGPTIAALPGGGYLFEEAERVWRVDPQGVIHLVAGNGGYHTFGDGGPAVEASFATEHIAALPDGGFLIADEFNKRVRMVDARGIITTVAGGGREHGDGVPATRARLDEPWSVATTPDGGFVVVDDQRVRRVGPDGLIRTIAGNGDYPDKLAPARGEPATSVALDMEDVAMAGDGSVLLADLLDDRILRVTPDGHLTLVADLPHDDGPISVAAEADGGVLYVSRDPRRVWRIAPDGSRRVIAGAAPFESTAPDGLLPRLGGGSALHAFLGDVHEVAALPDGGVLVSAGASAYDELGGFIGYIAPAAPRVLAAALARTRDRVIGPLTFASLSLTLPATVTLTVAGHVTTTQLPAGRSRVELPAVPADRPHRLWLAATAADGQRTYDDVRLYPPVWLPQQTAELLANTLAHRVVHLGDSAIPVDHCRRFDAGRIDCRLHGERKRDCASITLSFAGGRVRWGGYGCRLREHPHYTRRLRPLSGRDAGCHPGRPGCLAGRIDEAALLPSR
jgi:hypothetical protein